MTDDTTPLSNITTRDQFAAAALNAVLLDRYKSLSDLTGQAAAAAKEAYAVADAMLSEEAVNRARKAATGKQLPVEKRTGKDGKARKMPIAEAARLAHAMERSGAIAQPTAARERISDRAN